MKEFFYSTIGSYITIGFINFLVYVVLFYLKKSKAKIEQVAAEILPLQESANVNSILDALEKLVEASVQDANNRIVNGLKSKDLFNEDVAQAVKESVINNVITNMGPLKDQAMGLLGPLESVIGSLIEKYVAQSKVSKTA